MGRRSSSSACARRRCSAGRSRSSTSSRSSGSRRPRKESASREPEKSRRVCRSHRRDLREIPAKGHSRDQRARRRDRPRGGRSARARARLRPPARGRLPAEARAPAGGGAGGRRVLRPGGAGDPEVPPAPARRPDGDLRHELPEVRRRRRGGVAPVPPPRAPHRRAEARRRHGRARRRLPQLAQVPARRRRRSRAGGAPAVDADDPSPRRARHRRVARRAAREDALLERLQGARALVGRTPAVLNRRRAAGFAALAGALAAYYATSHSWPNVSTWWDVAFLGILLVPAVFGLVYAFLPFWRAPLPQLVLLGLAFAAVAAAFQSAGLVEAASFAKLGATAAAAFVFLGIFENATWVALIAALIPWVDAYSVFWGPTSKILKHPKGISALSFAFPIPGESGVASLGLPDLVFFALFLAAAARFRLRVGATFVLMALSFGVTTALAAWTNRALPATPLLSVAFLLANADLLWREWRRPASESSESQADRAP